VSESVSQSYHSVERVNLTRYAILYAFWQGFAKSQRCFDCNYMDYLKVFCLNCN
jgi:hypothetical protein